MTDEEKHMSRPWLKLAHSKHNVLSI